jgi:hypothetical protein
MKIILFIIISLGIFLQNGISQEENIAEYFPLNTGNVWVYNWIYFGNPSNGGVARIRMTNDTLINSVRYFKIYLPVIEQQFLRIDSISGNIYAYNHSGGCSYHFGETMIDSLCSKKNDTAAFCDSIYRKCVDTGFVNLFSNQYPKKDFQPLMVLTASSRYYAKGLGLYYMDEGDPYLTRFTLKGCVINGVVYGDTTVPVGIKSNNFNIPDNFSLSQNYPNPFNPVTKIKFTVPLSRGVPEGRGASVNLKIYDILGREIATLVNEPLSPGAYEVEWDASNYPSGVYFYKLITAGYTETRKMVLVK